MSVSPREIPPGAVSDETVAEPVATVPITREQREIAWQLAQDARRRMAGRCGVINQRYDELKRQRVADHHARFDALRAEREVLLHPHRATTKRSLRSKPR